MCVKVGVAALKRAWQESGRGKLLVGVSNFLDQSIGIFSGKVFFVVAIFFLEQSIGIDKKSIGINKANKSQLKFFI